MRISIIDIVYPRTQQEGYNFCVVCGKQDEYRLHQHLQRDHPDLFMGRDDRDKEVKKERLEVSNKPYVD